MTTQTPIQSNELKINSTHTQDVQAARLSKVMDPKLNRNPLSFENSTDRQAAILARAQHIIGSPQYAKMKPEIQQKLLGNYYDKYVAPGYTQKGFQAPDKDNWVKGISLTKNEFSPADYYHRSGVEAGGRVALSASAGAGRAINVAGNWIDTAAYKASVGLQAMFPTTLPRESKAEFNKRTGADILSRVSDDIATTSTFFFNTHPTKSWQMQMMSPVGEVIGSLPLYEAIGAARLAGAGTIPSNMTKVLSGTKAGLFVAKRLGEASDAFFGSLLDGQKVEEAGKNAAAWAALSTTGAGIKLAGTGIIKAFSARVAAQGGQVLQHALTDEAVTSLNELKLGHDDHGNSIHLVPTDENTGHFKVGEHKFEYKNVAERQHQMDFILGNLHANDPVKHNLIKAEQHVLNSMAQVANGTAFKDLSKEAQNAIINQRDLLHETGIAEISIHEPEQTKKTITESLQNDIQQFPMLGQTVARLNEIGKKWNINVVDALHEAETEKVVKETGIQNAQNTIKKTMKAKPAPLSPERVKANQESVRAYVSFKVNNLAYLKNISSKASKAGQTVTGKAKNLQIEKWLDGLDHEDFLKELSDETGTNNVKFENPTHQLLWANQYREKLPKPIASRIQQELHELDPTGTHKRWDEKSQNLAAHMEQLAYTGHLFNEGNIFKSTKIETLTSRTKFQRQLLEETEQQELGAMKQAMAKYPKQFKTAANVMKRLQLERRKVKDPTVFKMLTDEIRAKK